jgi:hypothetical protein
MEFPRQKRSFRALQAQCPRYEIICPPRFLCPLTPLKSKVLSLRPIETLLVTPIYLVLWSYFLPFDHTGGELLLRHQGCESVFDGRALHRDTRSAAYVAPYTSIPRQDLQLSVKAEIWVLIGLSNGHGRHGARERIISF